MDSLPCDVVLLPNPALSAKAIDASQKLAQFDSLFVLDNVNFYAHASLYMLQLKTSDVDKTTGLLSTLAKTFQPFSLTAARYDQTQQFIDAQYQVTSELNQLQNEIIKALNPVRSGMREKDKERMLEATGLALEYYQQYGYKYVGELFRPHITLTRLKTEVAQAETVLPDIANFNGIFDRIGFFKMGDNGTCIRKIAEFKFIN